MKVQYRIEHLRTDKPEQHLNELGAEGWELVSEFRPSSGVWIFIRRPAPILVFAGQERVNPEILEQLAETIKENNGY